MVVGFQVGGCASVAQGGFPHSLSKPAFDLVATGEGELTG